MHLTKLAKAVASTKQKRLQQREIRKHVKSTLQHLRENEELFFDESITRAEDEQTAMAKEDTSKAQHKAISTVHKINNNTINTSILHEDKALYAA